MNRSAQSNFIANAFNAEKKSFYQDPQEVNTVLIFIFLSKVWHANSLNLKIEVVPNLFNKLKGLRPDLK